jgi:hypothetical protein
MTRFALSFLLLGTAAALPAGPSAVQAPAAPTAPAAQADAGAELYHVHFVKAAPGKLVELIDEYVNAPANPLGSTPPVLLRHRQGDDWNLLVLTPLGAEATLRAVRPSAERMQFFTRIRTLGSEHNDTFAIGPVWPEAQKLVLGERAESAGGTGTGAVYVVSVFRSVPGHREQLEGALRKSAADDSSSRTLMLQHMEGASWEFLTITRYDSWAAFGESEQKTGAQPLSPTSSALALTEHLAEHHDTVAERVTRAAKPRQD